MAHNTRSHTKSPASDSDTLSTAEAELLRQQFSEKEKRLNKQEDSLMTKLAELQKREEEFEKKLGARETINTGELQNFLTSIRHELRAVSELPREFQDLNARFNTLRENIALTTKNEQESRYQQTSPLKKPESFTISAPPPPSNPFIEPSPIRLKDVADSIPKYDGQRISIYQFCTACERALNLISSNHEPYLVQLILSKLQGYAYTAVEGSTYTSVSQLLQRLKQIFGPNKSLNQYRGELGNAFMKSHENIFDYIARIKELKTAIIDCEANRAASFRYFDEWTIDNVEQEVLESFINGLPSELLMRVRLEGYNGLDDAFVKTIQISKSIEAEKARSKSSLFNKPVSSASQDSRLYNPKPAYSRSEQSPHILQRPQQPYIKPLIPGQPGPNAPSSLLCRYCKTPGHSISNCRKLAYKNSLETTQGSSSQIRDTPGNEFRVPTTSDVHRDAEQMGRPVRKSVRFEEPTQQSLDSPKRV